MSGVEVITTVQLIDACVGITRTIIEIGQAARDAKGLPDRLKELFERLPAIESLLKLARENHDKVPSGDRESVEPTLRQCKTSLEELKALFWKACPEDREHYSKRIWRGTKTVFSGRESQLLRLLDTILGNLKLLEQMKVYEIDDRLDSLLETVQLLAQDESPRAHNTHHGSGNQNIHQGSGHMYFQGGGVGGTFHQHFAAPLTKTEDLCLQSLAFPDMETRGDIDPAADQTCEWILQHAKYLDWNRQGGLLWIKGRPGTGKSTLMEYLRKTDLQNSNNIGESETLVLSFFFHRRGHELQKTPLGLFRSLLHQILRCDQKIMSLFVKDTRFEARYRTEGEPGKSDQWDWTTPDLQSLFSDCVLRVTKAKPIRLYIDALDESGENVAIVLMDYLKSLQTRAEHRLKICVSCRPWPDVIYGWQYCIDVVEENAQDIKHLLRAKLRNWLVDAVEIENEVASRSSGVFQWTVVVVERVLSLRKADTATILLHITEAPGNLDDIYHGMISKLVEDDREAASRLFRWLSFAKRPLSLTEIRHAVAVEANTEVCLFKDYASSLHWCDSDDKMRERLRRLSFGLIKILETHDGETTVQFDHESVQDYMLNRGVSFLEHIRSVDSAEELRGRSELILSRVCFHYLARLEALQDDRVIHGYATDSYISNKYPFALYAVTYCWIHASDAEISGHSAKYILELAQWPDNKIAYMRRMPVPDTYSGRPLTEGAIAVQHYAACHGISSIIEHLTSKLSKRKRFMRLLRKQADNIDAKDRIGRTPLWYAACQGHVSIVESLLNTRRVDVNARDRDGTSPICIAARQGRYNVVSILCGNTKIEVDIKNDGGFTPFAAAASQGHENIVRLLLQNKEIDVEAKDRIGSTPLANAVRCGHEGIVQLLLRHEGVDPESRDMFDETPLSLAASGNHVSVVQMLLRNKRVSPRSANALRQTPLLCAAYSGSVGVVRQLLKHEKVDFNARDIFDLTPLMVAAAEGHLDVVELLLENDLVDVNATLPGSTRSTGLWQAASRGQDEIVKAILRTGKADTNVKGLIEGDRITTPLEIAEVKGHQQVVDILREYEKEQG
ncbi:Ankyrin-3 [Cercospora beticola]|uniref:Ankyrin-3 n=1 Tax=Cercospora beticola TaxID=122368 RepID=A0A2G5I4V0_CERBT|nr:Ankyrin-3 [Cercospora beticola]PIA99837.1 Ankyrin-3 [Cercospora beticola]WPB00847.1 hypothetical protein RHO25_005467 [Cercospora beticola]